MMLPGEDHRACWFCERVLTSPERRSTIALPHPEDYCSKECALADLSVDIIIGSYHHPKAKQLSGGVVGVLAMIKGAQWPMTSR